MARASRHGRERWWGKHAEQLRSPLCPVSREHGQLRALLIGCRRHARSPRVASHRPRARRLTVGPPQDRQVRANGLTQGHGITVPTGGVPRSNRCAPRSSVTAPDQPCSILDCLRASFRRLLKTAIQPSCSSFRPATSSSTGALQWT